jgi:hypothetical protein
MPRFFFNIRESSELIEDTDGEECPSLAQAQERAVRSARELMSERVFAGKKLSDSKFEIVDEEGRLALVLPFQDTLD